MDRTSYQDERSNCQKYHIFSTVDVVSTIRWAQGFDMMVTYVPLISISTYVSRIVKFNHFYGNILRPSVLRFNYRTYSPMYLRWTYYNTYDCYLDFVSCVVVFPYVGLDEYMLRDDSAERNFNREYLHCSSWFGLSNWCLFLSNCFKVSLKIKCLWCRTMRVGVTLSDNR